MKNKVSLIGFVFVVAVLLLTLPAYAQEDGPEPIPVSGTYNYTPNILSTVVIDGTTYFDVTADAVWFGDFEGTEVANYRAVIEPSDAWDSGVISEFDGTVLGEYEGTMVIWSVWKRMSSTAHWYAEWWILSGTGDLANIYGRGHAWGPGFNPEDPEAEPDVYYSGEVFFAEPMSE
jgi:hypothetical protein